MSVSKRRGSDRQIEQQFDRLADKGLVRLRVASDDMTSFEDYEGDVYSAAGNPGVPASQLRKEREEAKADFYNQGGAVILIGEIFEGGKWSVADSVGGIFPPGHALSSNNPYKFDVMWETVRQVQPKRRR